MENRVKAVRKSKGLTVVELAELVGLSHTHVSRIENGQRGLSLDHAREFASAMQVSVAEIMGLETEKTVGGRSSGIREDAAPFRPGPGASLSIRHGKNIDPWTVTSNSLDRIGLVPGTIIFVDVSADAVDHVKPLQGVVAQVYGPGEQLTATTIIRQFVPPSLLITNSSGENDVPLDVARGQAVIKGVIIGHYHGVQG